MRLNVAVQMDPIERINIRGDSTFALLLEAQSRAYPLSYYTPDRLVLHDGKVSATVRPLAVRDIAGDHFTLGEPRRVDLSAFDVVLLRQDPPFDLAYISPRTCSIAFTRTRLSSTTRPMCATRRKKFLSPNFPT